MNDAARSDIALSVALIAALFLHAVDAFGAYDIYLVVIGAVLGTMPVVRGAWAALRAREWASMDMLASIALIFSLLSAEWASAVFISLMLAAARILDEVTHERTERSIKGLLKLRPETAKVDRGGVVENVSVEQLAVGETVIIDIGERVPVDGVVIAGQAAVDESSLSGESLPVEKSAGSRVMSSTILSSGSLTVRATSVGKDTTIEKVIALVERSRAEKPDTQTLGERFGKLYLVSVFVGSFLLLAITHEIMLVLAVVLVVCADDVAVAIPLAYLRAIGSAAARGVIVKGGKHLEVLGSADIVVFDKTGTLTAGKLSVARTVAADGHDEREVLATAARAARRFTHPLSVAIAAAADAAHVGEDAAEDAEEIGGKGVRASLDGKRVVVGKRRFMDEEQVRVPSDLTAIAERESDVGRSVSFVAVDGAAIGCIAISDTLKPGAREAIRELKRLGIRRTIMLTGDNERVARHMAHTIGIDEYRADLLPEDKVAYVQKLEKQGIVAMVGDGVNDAAALSAAHVGVAMGALGAEGAIESAEVVLMRDDLAMLPATIRLARSTKRIAIQDFWIWGATNLLGLGLVFGGVIGPAGAAAYNFISDFFPLLNSIRARMSGQGATR